MSKWLVERRLSQTVSRLASLRGELAQIDEQLTVVADEAADHELRAMVSETPLATRDAAEARKHADALMRHREHILSTIQELQQRQDELLDSMSESA
jgi:predicted  nucleic acid-binding Zn-ribbon protein